MKDDLLIFFDADVLYDFLMIDQYLKLFEYYKSRVIIPKPVYDELVRRWEFDLKLRFYHDNHFEVIDIELDSDEYLEYRYLTGTKNKPSLGKGEASCLVLARFQNGVVASNNLKDVHIYIKKYKIPHITTSGILCHMVDEGYITFDEASNFWLIMINKGRKLPTLSFEDYYQKPLIDDFYFKKKNKLSV